MNYYYENSPVYLWDLYSTAFCKRHKINFQQFCKLDDKYGLLKMIKDNMYYFDNNTVRDGVSVLTRHIKDSGGKIHEV